MTLVADPVLGANAERARTHNRQLVLGQLRAAGRAGRAEIARASGLSTQAVSNIIADLVAEGMIAEQGTRSAGRGLPAMQYALNPGGGFALGIEVRPDAVFAALLDLAGRRVFSDRRALAEARPGPVLDTIRAMRDTALAKAGTGPDRLLGIGVVMPGPFGRTGLSGQSTELPGWQALDARAVLGQALGQTVLLENDANAAAMAERVNGAAQALDTYAFLYFGTGLGLGVVSGGQSLRGAFGNAGEIGQLAMPGRTGPVVLEEAVSRFSVRRHMARAGHKITQMEQLDTLFAARDPALLAWLDAAAAPLSAAILLIENLFDPETVILGGAMPAALLDHLIAAIGLSDRSVANRPDRTLPRVIRGRSGRMTATLGAAALVLNQAFTPQIAAA